MPLYWVQLYSTVSRRLTLLNLSYSFKYVLLYLNIKLERRKKSEFGVCLFFSVFLCGKEKFFIKWCTENRKNAWKVYLWKKQIVSFTVCQGLKTIIFDYITSFFPPFVLNSIELLFYFSPLVKNRQNCANNPSSVCHSCFYDMHCIGNFIYCKIFGFS